MTVVFLQIVVALATKLGDDPTVMVWELELLHPEGPVTFRVTV